MAVAAARARGGALGSVGVCALYRLTWVHPSNCAARTAAGRAPRCGGVDWQTVGSRACARLRLVRTHACGRLGVVVRRQPGSYTVTRAISDARVGGVSRDFPRSGQKSEIWRSSVLKCAVARGGRVCAVPAHPLCPPCPFRLFSCAFCFRAARRPWLVLDCPLLFDWTVFVLCLRIMFCTRLTMRMLRWCTRGTGL